MKHWLPTVAAVAFGLVLAGLLFWPRGAAQPPSSVGAVVAPVSTVTTVRQPDASLPPEPSEATSSTMPIGTGAVNPDRATTPAETALQARLARPYNQHAQRAVAYWGQGSKFATQEGATAIAAEMNLMDDYLDGQAGLAVGELDEATVLQKELDLVAKVRAAHLQTPEIGGMMDYVEASAKVALAGGDPRTVVRPTQEQLKAGSYVVTTTAAPQATP